MTYYRLYEIDRFASDELSARVEWSYASHRSNHFISPIRTRRSESYVLFSTSSYTSMVSVILQFRPSRFIDLYVRRGTHFLNGLFILGLGFRCPDKFRSNSRTLKWLILIGDFCCCWIFIRVIKTVYLKQILVGAYRSKYRFFCAEINRSTSEEEMRVTNALWWYFFSKVIELLDTVWMILRKRNLQVTFLHVFHHATMVWPILK